MMSDGYYSAKNDYRAYCDDLETCGSVMAHHGVKGQKWGVRNYQNADGSLTAAGRKHYGYGEGRKAKGEPEDESDRKAKEILSKYQFNKDYTINDPLVKAAIKNAKAWDAGRSTGLYQNEDVNRKDSLKTIGKSAAIGAAAGSGAGLGRAAAKIAKGNKEIEAFNKWAAKGNAFTFDPTSGQTIPLVADWEPGYKGKIIGLNSVGGALIGAGVGAAVGTAIHASRSVKAKRANADLQRTINEIYQNPNVDKKTGIKLKNGQTSPDEDMAKVNPGFKNWSDGTKANCASCTVTYALRRKGYDVTANGANDGYDTTAFLQSFPKAKMKVIETGDTKTDAGRASLISKAGMTEGSYANMSVNWKNGGGHSMILSVENGQPVIRDCQSNKVYRGGAINKILSHTDGTAAIVRLDNADPDISYLKKSGLLNPLGQSFTVAPSQQVAGATTKGGKHGNTGLLEDIQIRAHKEAFKELRKDSSMSKEERQKERDYHISEIERLEQQAADKVKQEQKFGFIW